MHNIHNIMEIVQLNANAKLSEHLASPSEAALGHSNKLDGSHLSPNFTLGHSNKLDGSHLSPNFTLGEFTKSNSHPEVYNIPSHEAIANMKRLCQWLEELRKRYNDKYVTTPSLSSRPSAARGEIFEEPIRLNSGYRSPQLNRAIGGAPTSNHLTGCAVDIRVSGMEQLIRYAAILLDYADETHKEFDELLIEKNRYGAIWLHFAVRPKDNRRKVAFIRA